MDIFDSIVMYLFLFDPSEIVGFFYLKFYSFLNIQQVCITTELISPVHFIFIP